MIDRRKQKEEEKKWQEQKQKLGLAKTIIRNLYKHRKMEPLVLFALSIVPENKYVSRRYIDMLIDESLDKYEKGIMLTLSLLTRKGLLEKCSLVQYRGKGASPTMHQKLEYFIQESVFGPVSIIGQGQTQSVFRLTEKGRNKLKLYNIDLRSLEEKLLDRILGNTWEQSLKI